ncbi:MAG: IS4 family transposase [Planctomycetaceae bacterium]|nr:IS4 family transposase [Planctomycetales bacterium]MCB9920659.1 IS4 family transposase [Planctomycetaceae bacterium]MCB9921833.1 IS4 family transposase [Planctomycetaceae bacterium]
MSSVPEFDDRRSSRFQSIVNAFLSQSGLPFAHVLSVERIERVFAKHGNLFAASAIYSTAVMVWSFLGQVLRDGKEASCQAAVARVVTYCQQQDTEPPTADTGDYCKARAKLSAAALRELAQEIAGEVEDQAAPTWLFKDKYHAKLIDGFTFTMPDTQKNQKKFPHPRTQTRGVGLPIARAVAILSLATACVMDAAYGPYSGKETGESALMRTLLGSLSKGDIAVMDRYYCSFWMIAMLLSQGTQVCARKHHLRHSDFRRGQRLGKYDHLIVWTRPQRPTWMDEATYAQIPATLMLREIRYNVVEPGRRTRSIDVITTLVDADEFTKEEIAQLYGFRWNSELDIRSIKDSLNLGHVRCKSPEMVDREFWTTFLGYNLIRITAAGAAWLHDKQPRQISFVSTCQYVLSSWMLLSCGLVAARCLCSLIATSLSQIASCEVGNRPGRLEPRVLKRRRHGYKLMQQPRHVLRSKLRKKCT